MYRIGMSCPKTAFNRHNPRPNSHTTHRNPDVIHDIGGFREWIPTSILGPLLFIPSMDLIKGRRNDENAKNCVEVVLRWAASESGLGLVQVDHVADNELYDVEDEKCKSTPLSHGLDTHGERVELYNIPCGCCRSDHRRDLRQTQSPKKSRR